mgnify:CR=1 FL=1
MRQAQIKRETKETRVEVTLALDGRGHADIHTGLGFLDHMLTLLAGHGRLDLTVKAQGDLDVDGHHTAEDIGICLGQALKAALGEKRGVNRYGSCLLPMDEALVICALDFSGRGFYAGELPLPTDKIGTFDTELIAEFMTALSANAGLTLHFQEMAGRNSHHIAEAAFKALGRSLRAAIAVDPALNGEIPSTKGVL